MSSLGPYEYSRNIQVQFRQPATGEVLWASQPGPQTHVLWTDAFEILLGGARGGGKSAALMAWLVKGNFDLPRDHPCFATVVNHPKYAALLLRRDATDLQTFIDEITPFYEAMGAKKVDDPPKFVWGKKGEGARIYTNHLKDESAFEKYKGANIARVGVEELTQISDLKTYLKLLSICRTPFPELRPAWSDAAGQALSTTNPDGPGAPWVRDRFVDVPMTNGKPVPWGTHMRDSVTRLTRIFIPARLSDNKYFGDTYRSVLMMQAEGDPQLMRMWLDGEWLTQGGLYFPEFRRNGPRSGDPVECRTCRRWFEYGDANAEAKHAGHDTWSPARHVVSADDVRLAPWWPRAIGLDWGFGHDSAAYWGCFNQNDNRLHIYREFVRSGLGTEELGAELARLTLPDLAGLEDPVVPMYLSHDAFHRDDVKTKAQQIAEGIDRVIGAGTAILLESEDTPPIEYPSEFGRRSRITLARAGGPGTVVAGWQQIKNLLRFRPLVALGEPDAEYARSLLSRANGMLLYEDYMRSFERKPEVLPGMLIHDCCPRLAKDLQDAVRNEDRPDEVLKDKSHLIDTLDGLRHLVHGARKRANRVPKRVYVESKVAEATPEALADPTRRAQVYRKAESDYRKQSGAGEKPFSIPRESERRRGFLN